MPKGEHLFKHGHSGSRLYGRWRGMIQRCRDPNSTKYAYYGGRGISVCDRWSEYPNFLADMGEPSPGQTLDRIDPDGNYEPTNCRWVSRQMQMGNRRNSIILTYAGKSQCLAAWARELGIGKETLKYRVEAGWPIAKMLSTAKFNNRGKERHAV